MVQIENLQGVLQTIGRAGHRHHTSVTPTHIAALSMLEVPLQVSHMDLCPLYEDCAFLEAWPGVPVGNLTLSYMAGVDDPAPRRHLVRALVDMGFIPLTKDIQPLVVFVDRLLQKYRDISPGEFKAMDIEEIGRDIQQAVQLNPSIQIPNDFILLGLRGQAKTRILRQLNSEGRTIIIVTHDSAMAKRTHRTALIADGEIVNEYVARAMPTLTREQLLQATHAAVARNYAAGSMIIAEGTDTWNLTGKSPGDRGDAAMVAYGAARFALLAAFGMMSACAHHGQTTAEKMRDRIILGDRLLQTQNYTDAEKLSLAFLEKNPNSPPVLF